MNTRRKYVRILLIVWLVLSAMGSSAQEQKSFCNPVNLSYRFQLEEPSRREAADPSIIFYKGKYFMFLSKSGGYYSSDNLVDWQLIASDDLPIEEYAPTAVVMRDTVFFMAIYQKVYKSADPESGKWEIAQDSVGMRSLDPMLFNDTDGRVYLFHGLSPRLPIRGTELDSHTFRPIGEEVEILNTDNEKHGWERTGDYNFGLDKRPYLEGPFVTKHNDKYYLQYSVPGTQFKSYADGMYVSEKPLGPYELAQHNPFSYKPEGFIAGAGHGSTFQDVYGNFWYAGTMSVSVKNRLERRIGLFPAFFDADGVFYAYTGFGDYPHDLPQKKMDSYNDYQPKWMLLSYNKPVEASSESFEHPKASAVNEDIRSCWSAVSGNKGEWLQVDLMDNYDVAAVQVNFAEEGSNQLGRSDEPYYQYLIEYSINGKNWKVLIDKSQNKIDAPHDYTELQSPVKARYVRIVNQRVPDGRFAISGFRVFGKGNGALPSPVERLAAIRDTTDGCHVSLKWQKSPEAIGYNIRYGTAPDKLYQNYQVYSADSLDIYSLNSESDYYFIIVAFNENGVRDGMEAQLVESPAKSY